MNIRWVLLPLLLPLAGCNQYWERTDSVNTEFGNAVAANMAIQTVDPWPAHAQNTNIPYSGERMQRAVERYRTGGGAGAVAAGPAPSP